MKLTVPKVTFTKPKLSKIAGKERLLIGINFDGMRQFTEAYALHVQKALLVHLPSEQLLKVIRLAAAELTKREKGGKG